MSDDRSGSSQERPDEADVEATGGEPGSNNWVASGVHTRTQCLFGITVAKRAQTHGLTFASQSSAVR